MKKYLSTDFIIPFLWFIILQPLIFFFTMFVFFSAVYNSIWS